MFEKITIMSVAGQMARHATSRQSLISQNIAHADTPNFKAKDVTGFSSEMSEKVESSAFRATRSGHVGASEVNSSSAQISETNFPADPNGNTVSIEREILKSIEVERQHSKALAVYKHSVDLLKTSIGRGR